MENKAFSISRKIGNTLYRANIHCSSQSTESFEKKLMRLIRQHEVRFIAIANNVDSNDPNSNEFTPFMNIMNEWYLRDQSRKMRAAVQQKGRSGKPITTNAPYGYKKDPEDHNHWIVDEEAAAVVRRIFHLSVEGHGPYEIATILTRAKVESPGYYFSKQNCTSALSKPELIRKYDWVGTTVLKS